MFFIYLFYKTNFALFKKIVEKVSDARKIDDRVLLVRVGDFLKQMKPYFFKKTNEKVLDTSNGDDGV